MSAVHAAIHGALGGSLPFLAMALAVSVLAVGAALIISRAPSRLSAASRYAVISGSLFVPLAIVLILASGAGSAIRERIAASPAAPAEVTGIAISGIPAAADGGGGELACVLFALWALVAAVLVARLGFEARRWSVVAAGARLEPGPRLRELHRRATLRAATPSALRQGLAVREPMTAGLFHSSIVLPAGFEAGLSDDEVTAVLLHELTHARRRDNLTALVHRAILGLVWFDPLHWIALGRLLELREAACDEGVLDQGCDPRTYLDALYKSCHAAGSSSAVACMSGIGLRERMETIMEFTTRQGKRRISPAFVRTLIVLFLATAGLGVGVLAPLPVFAGAASRGHRLSARVETAGERIALAFEVRTPDGTLVSAPRITTAPGQQVVMTSETGGRTYRIAATPGAGGTGSALLEVIEGGKVLETVGTTIVAAGARSEAEPVSLELVDAELGDLLATFSVLTGRNIVADPGVEGKISIKADKEPWTSALERAVASAGLTLVAEGEGFRVRRASPVAEMRDPGVTRPREIESVPPVYTPEAKEAGVEGIVVLRARIDPTGKVVEVTPIEELSHGLTESAMTAVRQWKFLPGTRDGVAVETEFNVTIRFKLDEDA